MVIFWRLYVWRLYSECGERDGSLISVGWTRRVSIEIKNHHYTSRRQHLFIS